ncbi:Imm52 family immunity protein [Galbibacter sp.]|uniref:Imm52 family immunity protein n=1 Tax=Galbibacter sp. TaxID=2918471 RepID=UPI003A921424
MKHYKRQKIIVAWHYRKLTLKECTESFIIFIERLKLFDLRLYNWYEGANSKTEAIKNKAVFEYGYMKNRFCKNCNDDDYPEFTFDIGFWNGALKDEEAMSISASLGGEAKFGNNNCILSLPSQGEIFEYYQVQTNYNRLVELFIDHWKPEKIMGDDGKWIYL